MLRPASRLLLRPRPIRSIAGATPSRRLLSTAPHSQQSRSWKNYGVRLALAGGAVYLYNTNDVFAEEPAFKPRSADYENEPENLPTIEALAEQRKQKRNEATSTSSTEHASTYAPGSLEESVDESQQPGSVQGLEDEAGQQGAFNPETGEINWDCPCLGGMAHGPCGEEFRAAFSCFVYSEADPKGMDCIDKFQGMQTCFRQHPDVYGAELEEDEAYERERAQADADGSIPDVQPPASKDEPTLQVSGERPSITGGEKVADRGSHSPDSEDSKAEEKRQRAKAAQSQVKSQHQTSESEGVAPGS